MRKHGSFWKFRLEFWASDGNHHGTQKRGEPWNEQTVTGPRFSFPKMDRKAPGIYWRIIYYKPSGACLWLDIYEVRRCA